MGHGQAAPEGKDVEFKGVSDGSLGALGQGLGREVALGEIVKGQGGQAGFDHGTGPAGLIELSGFPLLGLKLAFRAVAEVFPPDRAFALPAVGYEPLAGFGLMDGHQ